MKFLFLCLMYLQSSFLFAQQFIEWNYDGTARASGTGCNTQNIAFITAGHEISVIFSQMGINLQRDTNKREVRVTCNVNIPAKIKSGKFI